MDSKGNLSESPKVKPDENNDITKKGTNKHPSDDKNISDEKISLDNEKLITNYKKIIAPVKTGKTIDLDKIKKQEKSVEASRRKKRREF